MFITGSDLQGRRKATAYVLESLGLSLFDLRFSEMPVVWGYLKDEDFVWRLAEEAFLQRTELIQALRLRLAATFIAGGVRPRPNQLSDDVVAFLEELAYALKNLRQLKKVSFFADDRDDMRLSTGFWREPVTHQLECGVIDELTWMLRCVRQCRNDNVASAERLADALLRLCLLPEDIGITAAELAAWRRAKLVEQARTKFGFCLAASNTTDVFLNVYGGLLALIKGIPLAEAQISVIELLELRRRLEVWLPRALRNPSWYGSTKESLLRFEETVFPMFDQILPGKGHLVLIR